MPYYWVYRMHASNLTSPDYVALCESRDIARAIRDEHQRDPCCGGQPCPLIITQCHLNDPEALLAWMMDIMIPHQIVRLKPVALNTYHEEGLVNQPVAYIANKRSQRNS